MAIPDRFLMVSSTPGLLQDWSFVTFGKKALISWGVIRAATCLTRRMNISLLSKYSKFLHFLKAFIYIGRHRINFAQTRLGSYNSICLMATGSASFCCGDRGGRGRVAGEGDGKPAAGRLLEKGTCQGHWHLKRQVQDQGRRITAGKLGDVHKWLNSWGRGRPKCPKVMGWEVVSWNKKPKVLEQVTSTLKNPEFEGTSFMNGPEKSRHFWKAPYGQQI